MSEVLERWLTARLEKLGGRIRREYDSGGEPVFTPIVWRFWLDMPGQFPVDLGTDYRRALLAVRKRLLDQE